MVSSWQEKPFIFTKRNSGLVNDSEEADPETEEAAFPRRPKNRGSPGLAPHTPGDQDQEDQGFTSTHAIIVGVVGSVIVVAIVIAVSQTVYHHKKGKKLKSGETMQPGQERSGDINLAYVTEG